MAYFPPFKLLFLLTALLLVVDSGVNLKGENYHYFPSYLQLSKYNYIWEHCNILRLVYST